MAQPTKQGFLFVFNSAADDPLWPIEDVAAADGYFAPKLGTPKSGAGAYITFALPKK